MVITCSGQAYRQAKRLACHSGWGSGRNVRDIYGENALFDPLSSCAIGAVESGRSLVAAVPYNNFTLGPGAHNPKGDARDVAAFMIQIKRQRVTLEPCVATNIGDLEHARSYSKRSSRSK